MRKILVVVEQIGEELDEVALELLSAARALGEVEVTAALVGHKVSAAAHELARGADAVHVFDDPAFDPPDGELAARVLAPWVRQMQPFATLLPHTNLGMELAPALAVYAGAPLVADCLQLQMEESQLGAVRSVYAGKVHARVAAEPTEAGVMVTVRPGAYQAVELAAEARGEVHGEALPAGIAPRRRHVETVAPERGAVDLSQAEVLVGVGRGIQDEENLEMIESLAQALGAEVACTRPVVDQNWLEKSRQIGTSGATVSPRLYLAVGISGSFQHMGGIRGKPFIAAINSDPRAPIFGQADVGVVGDLLELVPRLEKQIRERKG